MPVPTKALEDFGLSSSESQVLYVLLRSKTSLTGNEVAMQTNITRYYVFSILKRLAAKGFVEEIPERPRRYYSTLRHLERMVEILEEENKQQIEFFSSSNLQTAEVLSKMGFDEDYVLVYKSIEKEQGTRNELTKKCQLGYERVRKITETLVDKRFLKQKSFGKTYVYSTVPLDQIVEIEQRMVEENWKERRNLLQAHINVFVEQNLIATETAKRSEILLLRERRNVERRIHESCLKGKEVLNSQFAKISHDVDKVKGPLKRALFKASELIENDVSVKWLVEDTFPFLLEDIAGEVGEEIDDVLVRLFQDSQKLQIRISPYPLSSIITIDNNTVFDLPATSSNLRSAILFEGELVAEVKREEFLDVWKLSQDIRPLLVKLETLSPRVKRMLDTSLSLRPLQTFKVVLGGDSLVGKTTLVRRFCTAKFVPNLKATIGIEFNTKSVEVRTGLVEQTIKLSIFDFAGEEKFRHLWPGYAKGANGLILAFDPSNSKSFENLGEWLSLLGGEIDIPMILITTKNDLEATHDDQDIQELMDTHGFNRFYKTSALSGENVEELFNSLTEEIVLLTRKEGRPPSLAVPKMQAKQFASEKVATGVRLRV